MKLRTQRPLSPWIAAAALLTAAIGCQGQAPDARDADATGRATAAVTFNFTGVAPQTYVDPQHESPVRAEPGDLLLIPGLQFDDNARVVYHVVDATTPSPANPTTLPTGTTTDTQGTLTPLKVAAYGVTVVLPTVMRPGTQYAFWVANPNGSGGYLMSSRVNINDPRPMWLSPPYVYETKGRPGLDQTNLDGSVTRKLKVVGRNLQPAQGSTTYVNLIDTVSGASTGPLRAANDNEPKTEIERYVAEVTLPATLHQGNYSVQVSRDGGATWAALGTTLDVRPDPAQPAQFNVSDPAYGDKSTGAPCKANDEGDDAECIVNAITAASSYVSANPGATADVVLPPGTWIVDSCPAAGCATRNGITVPQGVNIKGSGGDATQSPTPTTIQTRMNFDNLWVAQWQSTPTSDCFARLDGPPNRQNLFALVGNNIVEDIRFTDGWETCYCNQIPDATCTCTDTNPICAEYTSVRKPNSQSIKIYGGDITVTGSFFDGVYYAIASDVSTFVDSWLGVDPSRGVYGFHDLVVTGNTMATYGEQSIYLGPIEDSVIARNTFLPGAFSPDLSNPGFNNRGPMAIGAGGSRRVAIDNNLIDGLVQTYSGTDRLGFRAGFFFPNVTSHENILVSGNTMRCIGTMPYVDGEAISFDNNRDVIGFKSAQPVSGTPTASVVPVLATGYQRNLTDPQAFVGRWLRVDSGPGLGQTRKITGVQADPVPDFKDDTKQIPITFYVSPPFDVAPTTDSRIIISQQAWQAYIVDNVVNNTSCTIPDTTNLHFNSLGQMQFFEASADSVFESNEQYGAAGIYLEAAYRADYSSLLYYQKSHYFDEIAHNTIDGIYGTLGSGPGQNKYGAGIVLGAQSGLISSSGAVLDTPDIMGFGVAVFDNATNNAGYVDYAGTGTAHFVTAVSISTGLNPGVESYVQGYDNTLVFGNHVTSVPAPAAGVTASSIMNGDRAPNYPKNTFICYNAVVSPPTGHYEDILDEVPPPPAPVTSSVFFCPTASPPSN